LWLPPLLIMAVIFWLSSLPAAEVKASTEFVEVIEAYIEEHAPWAPQIEWLKVGQVIGYGLLGISLYRAFAHTSPHPFAFSLLVVLGYAISNEIHQNFVPGRSGSWQDVLLDVAAAALCIALLQGWLEKGAHKPPP
jgi:VanZ family protein